MTRFRFALTMLLLALCPVAAPADTVAVGKEGRLLQVLKAEPGARACFRRVYDAKHLKAHPKQTVTEMEFRLAYHKFPADEFYPQGQRNYYFDLLVKRRGHAETASGGGECAPQGDKIFCGVECDGGGLNLEPVNGGVRLSFGDMWGIRLSEGCDETDEGNAELTPGADDKTFLLTPIADCPAYEKW
jgi:hypothetical protein